MNKTAFQIGDDRNEVILKNGTGEIVFNKSSGGVVKVTNSKGKVFCDVSGLANQERLFRIVGLRRRQRGATVDSTSQTGALWNFADKTSVTITYPNLSYESEQNKFSAVVRISNIDDEFVFSMELHNTGDLTAYEIQFPMFPGFKNKTVDNPLKISCGAKTHTQVGTFPKYGFPTYACWHQRFDMDYPHPYCCFPWFDFYDEDGGLTLTNYMTEPLRSGLGGFNFACGEKGSLECYWIKHYPLLKSGETWASPPVGVRFHEGDWHQAADRYYDWFVRQIGVTITQPDTLRRSIGFQNLTLRCFDGTRDNYEDAVLQYIQDGLKYNIKHVAIWDSPTIGTYSLYDSDVDMYEYTAAERKSLKDMIGRAKQLDSDLMISALTNFRHINVRSDLYETYKNHAVLCHDGSEFRECYLTCKGTTHLFAPYLGGNCMVLSPHSPMYGKRVHELLDNYIELGYNTIFYDQPFLHQLDYNFFSSADRPDNTLNQLYNVVTETRERMKAVNKNAYILGEFFEIFGASRTIDFHMEWNFSNQGPQDLARVLYACPHTLLSYCIDYTTADRAQANHAFAAGLLLCVSIDGGEKGLETRPELAEHIRKLAVLRETCKDRTVYGRFRETIGIELTGSTTNAGQANANHDIVAYVYDSIAGPAVILAAGDTGGSATVAIDRSKFTPAANNGHNMLYHIDGTRTEIAKTDSLSVTLTPYEIVVWYG